MIALTRGMSLVSALLLFSIISPGLLAQTKVDGSADDFHTRCKSAGVLVCEGFDSAMSFLPARSPKSGIYPAGDGEIRGSFDKTVKVSGNGSLKFEVPAYTPANNAGFWRQAFGHSFQEGSTFYVQFRQRFSKEMLSNNWGDTAWKQVIFHHGPTTCGPLELTTGNYYSKGFPIMYTNCGSRGLYTNRGDPPTKLEQGDYECWYGKYNHKDCFYYPADEWMTFYYEVTIGHWGKADSTINAWVALTGKPYRQWIKMPDFLLENDTPGEGFDSLTLLTYMTGKSDKLEHPTAYTWYDELIVSTQPIAVPK